MALLKILRSVRLLYRKLRKQFGCPKAIIWAQAVKDVGFCLNPRPS
jgi:hypothetical protein